MKQFKGKNIPEYNDPFIRMGKIQNMFCKATINSKGSPLRCKEGDCDECLFSYKNIEVFKEWYSVRNREDKLKRICQKC